MRNTTDIINNPASASDDAVDTETYLLLIFEEEVMDFWQK